MVSAFCFLFSSVTLSCPTLWTSWTAAGQASLSITNFWSLPKLMSIESVMPSSHLILCRPLLLLPSIFASIRVFSNESALHIRWPKYWSFSFNINPSNERPGLISSRMHWLDALSDVCIIPKWEDFDCHWVCTPNRPLVLLFSQCLRKSESESHSVMLTL